MTLRRRRLSPSLFSVVIVAVAVVTVCPTTVPAAHALTGAAGGGKRRPRIGTAAASTVARTPDRDRPAPRPPPSSSPPPHRASLTTVVAEDVWRTAAGEHRRGIRELLGPGLVGPGHPLMRSVRKRFRNGAGGDADGGGGGDDTDTTTAVTTMTTTMTMLDPDHPVYNFLVEYYGLKGLKGPKRLARWSPSIGLFFFGDEEDGHREDDHGGGDHRHHRVRRIDTLEEYHRAAGAYRNHRGDSNNNDNNNNNNNETGDGAAGRDATDRGIFLEGATPDDFGLTLYLQGAEWIDGTAAGGDDGDDGRTRLSGGKPGILYRPIRFYDENDEEDENGDGDGDGSTTGSSGDTDTDDDGEAAARKNAADAAAVVSHRKATSFVWYRSILETTLGRDPVLHCYGLHEWAMQYRPEGAPPPPSGRYQAHLPLRVPRAVINETVERKGIRCTHVDALRFFAPGAGELNHHGPVLDRRDQLRLEQPGCVHAHMDLLKIALRLKPYCDPDLLRDVLSTALKARTLDVGASPYDCSGYTTGGERVPIPVVPVETVTGRAAYKRLQSELMGEASAVRTDLLSNYEAYGFLSFTERQLRRAVEDPTDDRFAKAAPGSRSWRRNRYDRPGSTGSTSNTTTTSNTVTTISETGDGDHRDRDGATTPRR